MESRAPHTLVAMAEAGHGVAIIPSALRTRHYKVRIFGVTYRGKPLREQLVMLWDKRRPLPRYANSFCEMLAEHFRAVFPISRPSTPEQDGNADPGGDMKWRGAHTMPTRRYSDLRQLRVIRVDS